MKARWLAAVATVVLLGGCSLIDDDNGPLDEARSARGRWQQANVDYYTFDLYRSCYCPAQKVRIYVEADTIHSATYVDSGLPVVPEPGVVLYTIDELFDWLIGELRKDPAEARVWFDPEYHFPEQLYLDRKSNAIDDELWIYVQNFQKYDRLD